MSKNDTELAKLRTENARLRRIIEQQDAENADVTRLQLENENFKAAMKQQDESIKALEHDRNSLFAEWDANMAKSTKGEALRPLSSVSRVRKVPKAAEILENFPNVVWTGTRDPKTDRKVYEFDGSRGRMPEASEFRKRLVAPMAGFLSAGMEITLVCLQALPTPSDCCDRSGLAFRIRQNAAAAEPRQCRLQDYEAHHE